MSLAVKSDVHQPGPVEAAKIALRGWEHQKIVAHTVRIALVDCHSSEYYGGITEEHSCRHSDAIHNQVGAVWSAHLRISAVSSRRNGDVNQIKRSLSPNRAVTLTPTCMKPVASSASSV